MGKEVDYRKFTWVVKDFPSLQSRKIYSDEFVADGCKWRLLAFPKGNGVEYLSLYLDVAGSEFLPVGWRRHADFNLTVVNQLSEELSDTKATKHWFDASATDFGFKSMFPLDELHEKDGGFLVDGELRIVAEVAVLEVIGKLDVTEECQETTKALSKLEENDAVESKDSSVKEYVDVNGFRVFPSQVDSVRCIFERHPNIASEFRPKNQHLRSAYMNVLLSLIETLCQPTQELSKGDLAYAEAALIYLLGAGLNLNWLEEKLEQVSVKKDKEEAGETRMQEIEEELKKLKQKCSDLEAQLEKEKADVSVSKAPLSFDDVV
ncbi:PREDICTED: MATH domain and coiled-coil domain-containing protein At3g58270-like [Camelina sativa]|uniref:MATH domain and coiled-coil domain-containing protein At3g58270-like n=1 Tax=Camelina sativa TaxID=90675 RepID=A0ABM0ZJ55_CAMSA|nr:PREDICTED: MATH domain and coiled-coil domain-containing protein At3g58270-like [Camelina sativa]XP_010516474.1 PREDICTED: MATH domain and coiled-coil domain-containing protein At3g58270-like [Camelina sativa]